MTKAPAVPSRDSAARVTPASALAFMRGVTIADDTLDGEMLVEAWPELEEYAWLHAASSALSLAMLARHLPRDRPARILELGGAPYYFTALATEFLGAEVTAMNVEAGSWPGAPSVMRRETVRLNSKGSTAAPELSVPVWVLNMEKDPFPFEPGTFDAVLCMEVLEHLGYSPSHMLGEAHRVLVPGGLFFLTVPNFINLKRTVNMLLNVPTEFPYSGYGIYGRHQREFAPSEVRRLLEANHFSVAELATANVWPTFRESKAKGLGNLILNALLRIPLPWLVAKREYILCAARAHGEAVVAYPEWLYEHRGMYPDPPHGIRKVFDA